MTDLDDETLARLVHGVLFVLIVAASGSYARRAPRHRVVALLFVAYAGASTLHLALDRVLDAAATPYRGLDLVAYYGDHATILAHCYALIAAIYVQFLGRPALHVLFAFATALVVLIVTKESTGESLVPFHLAHWVFASVVAWALIAWGMIRPPGAAVPDGAHLVLMTLAGADAVRTAFSFELLEPSWFDLRLVDIGVMVAILVGYLIAIASATRA